MSSNPAFAINEDGSAKDAGAYRAALLADPEKVKAIQAEPELAEALLGEDVNKMQATLRQVHEANTQRADEDQAFLMNSMERMRARCTVPRDVVSIYEALNKIGLQYGPAFRLLTDVYVPESVANAQK